MRDEQSARLRHAGAVAAVVLLATVPRLVLHELWRDEAWLWLVVRESASVGALWTPLSRSGQGYLFPVLCFLVSKVWPSWRAMQALHLLFVTAAAFAVVAWAPFRRFESALLVAGYFPFYEYAVISRHYVVGALLVWLACAAARSRRPAIGIGLALGLACQTTVYGFILAIAVAVGWLLDRRLRADEVPAISRADGVIGALLALLGAIAGIVQLVPAPGTSFAPGWRFGWDTSTALAVLRVPWRAIVPLPPLALHFWNANLLDAHPTLEALGGAAVLAVVLALLAPRPVALATFVTGALGLAVFAYTKYVGNLRHHGHWWLLLVAALWLAGGVERRTAGRSWRTITWMALLLLQLPGALFASWMDLVHPFSNGAATAALLRAERLDALPLLGHREPPATSVALPLGRPLFSPSRGVLTTHPDYGPRQREILSEELRCAARALAVLERSDVVLVLNHDAPAWPELADAGATTGAIVATEDYHLYRLVAARLPATAAAAACPPGAPWER